MRRWAGALLRMAVDANARPLRPAQLSNAAAAGVGVALRVQRFGVDAPLHGIAAWLQRLVDVQA